MKKSVFLKRKGEMNTFKSICVNCGSNPGLEPDYMETAGMLGQTLVENNIDLVYGGSDVGLMGALAQAVLQNGGKVIGVIPESFADRVGNRHITELYVVESMHERKKLMFDLSDGFIALPGGFGTLEEIFELLTWSQLGYHTKPCGFLNVCGYFDRLMAFLDHTFAQQFVRQEHRQMVLVDDTVNGLLKQFETYEAPKIEKWIDKNKG
jgi:uncharacterized protein (TIGR00730 family)